MNDFPKHLSYSQVSTLRQCGEKYRLQRVWRVPEQVTWAQVGGSAVHAWTEAWDLVQHHGAEAVLDFSDYFDLAVADAETRNDTTADQFRATGRASKEWPNKENRDWWLANGPAMCNRWVNWRRSAPWDIWISPTGEPGIEVEIKVDLGKVPIHGFIDRVFVNHATGELIVVDIKTGAEVSSDGQLGLYKIGLLEALRGAGVDVTDVVIRWGAYWYGRTGATGSMVPLNEWTYERAVWEYEQADARRRRGDFQPVVDRHCSWCSVKDFCLYTGGARAGEVRPPWVGSDDWESEEAA